MLILNDLQLYYLGGIKVKKVLSLTLVLVFILGIVVNADDLTGKDIITKVDQEMKAENKIMEQEMILESSSGSKRNRSLQVYNKQGDENDKMMARFTEPANIKGTGFLMVGEDMWLYLPALDKVKRIAGSAKQGSFMGSDLSYEDMEALGNTGFSKDYDIERLEDKTIEGFEQETYYLRLIPKEKDVTYSKLEMYVDKEQFLPLKINYYQDENLVKVLTTSDHEEIDGKNMAMVMEMKNIDSGSKTILKIKDVEFPEEMQDGLFTVRYLERGSN